MAAVNSLYINILWTELFNILKVKSKLLSICCCCCRPYRSEQKPKCFLEKPVYFLDGFCLAPDMPFWDALRSISIQLYTLRHLAHTSLRHEKRRDMPPTGNSMSRTQTIKTRALFASCLLFFLFLLVTYSDRSLHCDGFILYWKKKIQFHLKTLTYVHNW